ncbi:MAG: ribosome biogenesis GTPase Der [Gammaproteobacteria bacterium]|nr:ribosome biogenesis GTPase Der [Gammaproteobacteria bacterium]
MARLPVVAIVGRPNVGKSTLFNCLTRSRDSLVADEPGVTRDRQYGLGAVGERPYIVVDTGGLADGDDPITRLIAEQVALAIEEASLLLFVVDARAGLTAADQRICADLRRQGKPLLLVVNKTDGLDPDSVSAEFHALGLGDPMAISAAHRRGIKALGEAFCERLSQTPGAGLSEDPDADRSGDAAAISIAVIGRPNVGKSTLVNRLTGSDRVVAHDMPGTTRDSVRVPFTLGDQAYVLIDTAGVRRRARVDDGVEKLSVLKTLEALASCEVAVLMIDARDAVTDQDAHLLGLMLDSGRAIVLAVNKWDGLDAEQRRLVKEGLERRLSFIDFAEKVFVSARHGSGLGELMAAIRAAYRSARLNMSTPMLTRILAEAVQRHPPPLVHGRRIKLRYAHQGGQSPPRIIIHGNQTEALPDQYKRYLARTYRNALDLQGTPIVIELRSGENPFKGIKNALTPRQQRRRKRLIRHVKGKR